MSTETQKIEFASLMDPIMEVGISLASYLSASRLRVPELEENTQIRDTGSNNTTQTGGNVQTPGRLVLREVFLRIPHTVERVNTAVLASLNISKFLFLISSFLQPCIFSLQMVKSSLQEVHKRG